MSAGGGGRSSRRKGKRGELEVSALLAEYGFDARRTPNSGGLSWRGDVQGVPGYVFEVKRCERLSLPAWLEQAYAAARGGEIPAVVFRQSGRQGSSQASPRGRWHAVIPLEELARLLAVDHQTVCDCQRGREGGESTPEGGSPDGAGLPGCGR